MTTPAPTQAIQGGDTPSPGGHYAPAVRAGDTLYVSGQLPIHPDGERARGASFEEQARLALDNVLALVAAAGGTEANLARVTVYLVGIDHWPRFDALYAARLGERRPARSVVPVPELHHGFLVEIDAIAFFPHPPATPSAIPAPQQRSDT